MKRLTREQIREFKENVEAMEKGRLFIMCNSCGNFYQVTRNNLGFVNMCKNCLKGVVIPTF